MLWRINTSTIPDDQQLRERLMLHLRYARLSTVLVQIQSRQQSYLITEGCSGCRSGRCEPNCRAQLLRRMLSDYMIEMQPVAQGLATRPYTQLLLAYPAANARLPDLETLAAWPELRMQLSWSLQAGKLRLVMLLALGASQVSAMDMLRAQGWRVSRLPGMLLKHYAASACPSHVLLPGRPTSLAIQLPGSLEAIIAESSGKGRSEICPLQVAAGRADTSVGPYGDNVGADRCVGPHSGRSPKDATGLANIANLASWCLSGEGAFQTASEPRLIRSEVQDDSAGPNFSSAYQRLLAVSEGNVTQNRSEQTASVVADTIVLNGGSRWPDSSPATLIETKSESEIVYMLGCSQELEPLHNAQIYTSDNDASDPRLHTLNPRVLPCSREQLGEWLHTIATEPSLQEGRVGRAGLAASRLAWTLGVPMSTARLLMVWLDDAGLLASPLNPAQAWSNPRPLVSHDEQFLVTRLFATDVPDDLRIQMAYARDRGSGVRV